MASFKLRVKHVSEKRSKLGLDKHDPLMSISPIDGRYAGKTTDLQSYFSEFGLIRYRLAVEVEYLIALRKLDRKMPQMAYFPIHKASRLRKLYQDFSLEDAQRIKEIEKVINHDVKAVEYFLKEKMDKLHFRSWKEFVHFGLTSQDVTNTALPLMMRDATRDVIMPLLNELIGKLQGQADEWADIPLLSMTHGQPASPTRLGKEIKVFVDRLEEQHDRLFNLKYVGKFGGATGNFNAHHVAYPDINWVDFGNEFLGHTLGITRLQTTTQIDNYDSVAEWCNILKQINIILLDLSNDMWQYISRGVFKLQVKEKEVGSSAMPHKVNPIDFENAEGNVHMAVALFETLARVLPVSRMQRDLSDSTLTRNLGMPVAYTLIVFKSTLRGLGKIEPNQMKIYAELESEWAVVAEAIQTILRREGFPEPYEYIKERTRGKEIDQKCIEELIDGLDVSDEVVAELRQITPWNYVGVA